MDALGDWTAYQFDLHILGRALHLREAESQPQEARGRGKVSGSGFPKEFAKPPPPEMLRKVKIREDGTWDDDV